MTEQQKQTRRARRARERAAGPIPGETAEETSSQKEASGSSAETIQDRNKRLRDQAARKRAKRKQERSTAAAEGLDTSERVDDTLTRSAHAASKFIQKNIGWLQWVIVFGAAGSIGYLIYEHRSELAKEKAGDALMTAVAAQRGNVAGRAEWRSPDSNLVDPRKEFASDEERLKTAEERYRSALGEPSTEGTRLYAHLGLAGVLFDQGRFADARAEYDKAKNNPLAANMPDAKGRALEGLALSFEAEGKREEALKAVAELEKIDGYGGTARYQRARLWHAQGESQKALEDLKKLQEELLKASAGERPTFLQAAVSELIRTIDPDAAPPADGQSITPEQLQELQRQFEELQRMQGQLPQNAPVEMPLGPAPTPVEEPAPAPEQSAPAEEPAPAPKPQAAPQAPAPKQQAPKPQPTTETAPKPQAPAPAAPTAPTPSTDPAPVPQPAPEAPAPSAPDAP